jgi:CHAT domain-containing protein
LKSSADADASNLLRAERSLAEIELREGNYSTAAATYDDLASRAVPQFGRQHPNLAVILHDGGVAHFAIGDLSKAESNVREALAITEARAREIAEQLSQAEALSFLGSVYPVRDALLSIELAKNPKLTFEQYQELEQARGIYTRTEMVANGAFGLTGPVDNQTTKDLSELADVRSFLAGFASYHGALARDERIPMVLDLITQEKERLQREVASREFKTLKSSNSPVDLKTLLESIGNGDAIVDIVASNIWIKADDGRGQLQHIPHYYAFILAKSGPGGLSVSTVDLGPRTDADQHVNHWLALLSDRSADPASEGIEADWIRQHLWDLLAHELLGARNILIVPDGVFNVMPWVALRSSTNDRFLIEDGYNFVTELSVESVGEAARRRDQAIGTGALLVGDLNFGNAPPGQTREIYVGTTSDGIWTALQGARAEMLAIEPLARQAGPVTVLRDDRATEIAVEQAMPNARFVHFATHGYFAQALQSRQNIVDAGTEFLSALSSRSQRSPLLRNGLVLSGANLEPAFQQGTIRINDGLLSAEEIAGLNLSQVELVVLSACETARGVNIAGEGSFGLRRTFLMAGARAVVAGLWRVNDQATKDLMLKFYDLLWHDHLPKAEALRRAQVYMIEKGRSESGKDSATSKYAPYYWAAFVISGDWK